MTSNDAHISYPQIQAYNRLWIRLQTDLDSSTDLDSFSPTDARLVFLYQIQKRFFTRYRLESDDPCYKGKLLCEEPSRYAADARLVFLYKTFLQS